MNYQRCRWYDPYPRLSFALKLLYLAPKKLQEFAVAEVARCLEMHLGSTHRHSTVLPFGNRWYDLSAEMADTMERLKESPEHVKELSAETLLSALDRAA